MAGFNNDTVYAEEGMRIGDVTISGSEFASIQLEDAGSDITLLISNTSNTAASRANQIIKVDDTETGSPYTRFTVGTSQSWAIGIPNEAGDAQNRLYFTYANDETASPYAYDLFPMRLEKFSASRSRLVVSSLMALASEGQSNGATVSFNIQNVESAPLSDANILIQAANPAIGGGANYITWGCAGQVQFKMGQGKDASATTQPLEIKDGTANFLGSTFMKMTPSGEVTFPLTPCFSAYIASNDTNVTGAGTTYTIGTNVAYTEVFDQNSDFNTNGTFTAPVSGRYLLSVGVAMLSLTAAMTFGQTQLTTSNRNYITNLANWGAGRTVALSADLYQVAYAVIADMDAADTAISQVAVTGGAGNTAGIDGAAYFTTYFSGQLLC